MSGFRTVQAEPAQQMMGPQNVDQQNVNQQMNDQQNTNQQMTGQQNVNQQAAGPQNVVPQAADQQAAQQQEQVSALERAIREVEKLTSLSNSTTDVAEMEGVKIENQLKEEKRSWWYNITKGLWGKIKVARLSKAARQKTRSDVQRMTVKERLRAIAKDLAGNAEVEKNKPLRRILEKIDRYGAMDVTAGEGIKAVGQEKGLYTEICTGLENYLGNAQYGTSDTLAEMATRLHVFFMVQQQGNLEVPSDSDNVEVMKDNLRHATLTKSRNVKKNVTAYFEDETTKDEIEEKVVEDQPLFVHEPSINDIRQGGLGDCFFLAALGSIVNDHPQTIKNCMRDNGKTVTVRFFRKNEQGAYIPVYVDAEKKIPVYKNKKDRKGESNVFAKGDALWVQMMERAYAIACTHLNGMDRFGNKVTDKVNERKTKHQRLKALYDNAKNNPSDKSAQRKFTNEINLIKDNLNYQFLFDDNGNFIPDYDSIPEDPSFVDIYGGQSKDVFQAIMGRDAEELKIDREAWVSKYAMKRLQHIYGPGDGSIPDNDDGNVQILKKALMDQLRMDPRLREGFTIDEAYMDTMARDFRKVFFEDMEKKFADMAQSVRQKRDQGQPVDLDQEIENLFTEDFVGIADGFRAEDLRSNMSAVRLVTQVLMRNVIRTVLLGVETAYPKEGIGEEYGKDDLAVYDYIKDSLAAGKMVTAGSRKFEAQNQAGLNHESKEGGFAETHAYTVLDVVERDTSLPGGVTRPCKFLKVRNPWGDTVARYSVEDGKIGSTESTDAQGKQGFFLVELHDFINRFRTVTAA